MGSAAALLCWGMIVGQAALAQEDHSLGIQEQAKGLAKLAGWSVTCKWTNSYQAQAMDGVSREVVAQSAELGQDARAKVEAARIAGVAEGKLPSLCGDGQQREAAQALGKQMAYMMALRIQALLQAEKKVPYGPGLTNAKAAELRFLFDEAKTALGRDYIAVRAVQERMAPKILASACPLRMTERAVAPRICPAVPAEDSARAPFYLTQLASAEAFATAYLAVRAQ